ncbi:MAG TPA: winged helix-turn-helix domain-containing protein [Casimicrobiaceae bacterium]|nr:winged helix-turn-helix domain-containing protein [Casimicrobiaceae bacterium]
MQTKPLPATPHARPSPNRTAAVVARRHEIGASSVVQGSPFDGVASCDTGGAGSQLKHGFRLGAWEVRPLTGEILGADKALHVEPKVMEVLLVLARRSGEVVERDDLLRQVWASRGPVSDEPLTRCIAELRRALGDSRQSPTYIQTIPKRGYRLLACARTLATGEPLRAHVQGSVPSDTSPVPERTIPINSIAVLPFAGASTSADIRDFCDDVAGEIRSRLMSGKDMLVVARTWSDAVGGSKDFRSIQAQLRVARVLEGRVQRNGDQVRIRIDLCDAQSGYLIWSESFEGRLTAASYFAIQDRIASAIVTKLGESLEPPSSSMVAHSESTRPIERRVKDRREGSRARNSRLEPADSDARAGAASTGPLHALAPSPEGPRHNLGFPTGPPAAASGASRSPGTP